MPIDDMGRYDGGRGKRNAILAFFFRKISKIANVFYGRPRRYLYWIFVSRSAIECILQKYDFNCTIKLSIFASMHRPLDQRHTVLKNFKYVTNDTKL